MNTLAKEITTLQRQLTALQRDLKEKKKKYEASVQYMYRNKSVQEKLMFIFSAENLSQTYRRMRYVQEYANYQRLQGLEIERKQRQVVSKKKKPSLKFRNKSVRHFWLILRRSRKEYRMKFPRKNVLLNN